MKFKLLTRKMVALIITLSLVLIPALSLQSLASTDSQGVPTSSLNNVYTNADYFNSVYPSLKDSAPVFEAITYSKLHYLLQQSGNYIILWGGKSSAPLQNDIAYIDQVAKQYSISTIYNFDPYLDAGTDGEALNIEGTAASTINAAKNLYGQIYKTLYPSATNSTSGVTFTDYLNDSTGATSHTYTAITSPTILIYNKDNVVGAVSTPVVGSYSDTSATGAVSTSDIQNLKTSVFTLFDKISTTINGNKVANASTFTDQQFYTTAFNYQATLNNSNTPTTIFDNSDSQLVFKSLTYDELQQLLQTKGNYPILFGGSWCPNTRAAIKWINQEAHAYNISTVYNFDTHLDDGAHVSSGPLDIRTTNSNPYLSFSSGQIVASGTAAPNKISNLYVDLVNKYLPNIATQYDATINPTWNNTATNVNYVNSNSVTVVAPKLQVPFLFTYNKDHTDASKNPAPINGELIVPIAASKNYANGLQELMYTWATNQPGVTGSTYPTYSTALNNLFTTFADSNLSDLVAFTQAKNINSDGYTASSYSTYATALANASSVLSKTKITTTGVVTSVIDSTGAVISNNTGTALGTDNSSAYTALQKAYVGLVLKPVITGVVNNGNYNANKTVTVVNGTATLDGKSFVSGTTVSSEGKHTLVVTDSAGSKTTIVFVIDKSNPVITAKTSTKVVVKNGGYSATSVTVSDSDLFSVTAAATLNGKAYSWPKAGTFSKVGTYVITVKDQYGHSSNTTFTIDETKPIIAVKTVSGGKTVTITETNLSTKTVTLNGKVIAWASGNKFTKKGAYIITATDKAGNKATSKFSI